MKNRFLHIPSAAPPILCIALGFVCFAAKGADASPSNRASSSVSFDDSLEESRHSDDGGHPVTGKRSRTKVPGIIVASTLTSSIGIPIGVGAAYAAAEFRADREVIALAFLLPGILPVAFTTGATLAATLFSEDTEGQKLATSLAVLPGIALAAGGVAALYLAPSTMKSSLFLPVPTPLTFALVSGGGFALLTAPLAIGGLAATTNYLMGESPVSE